MSSTWSSSRRLATEQIGAQSRAAAPPFVGRLLGVCTSNHPTPRSRTCGSRAGGRPRKAASQSTMAHGLWGVDAGWKDEQEMNFLLS